MFNGRSPLGLIHPVRFDAKILRESQIAMAQFSGLYDLSQVKESATQSLDGQHRQEEESSGKLFCKKPSRFSSKTGLPSNGNL